ncbi:hypothetical protein Smic_75130 [Streptomyces microflavus]|uniref:Uncharacterized protein n=1 Tax=Streptomyces microflavus TaxID=1919 RepID=A0A7J0D4H4_STRMI|nr:hypothetical protein Smic_75130 [Streptomyces microflavus]
MVGGGSQGGPGGDARGGSGRHRIGPDPAQHPVEDGTGAAVGQHGSAPGDVLVGADEDVSGAVDRAGPGSVRWITVRGSDRAAASSVKAASTARSSVRTRRAREVPMRSWSVEPCGSIRPSGARWPGRGSSSYTSARQPGSEASWPGSYQITSDAS